MIFADLARHDAQRDDNQQRRQAKCGTATSKALCKKLMVCDAFRLRSLLLAPLGDPWSRAMVRAWGACDALSKAGPSRFFSARHVNDDQFDAPTRMFANATGLCWVNCGVSIPGEARDGDGTVGHW